MSFLPTIIDSSDNQQPTSATVPALFVAAGSNAAHRFIEFFSANIRNRHTRAAYSRAAMAFACWCDAYGLALEQLTPVSVAAYVEELGERLSRPSVKQHLAALRMLFDYLVTGQVLPVNPVHEVRGPKHVVKTGRTPVLSAEETRTLPSVGGFDCMKKGASGTRYRPITMRKPTSTRTCRPARSVSSTRARFSEVWIESDV